MVNPFESLYTLIATHEDWLMNQVLNYAKCTGYTDYTSTLAEAWRVSIQGLSASILEAIETDPERQGLDPHTDYSESSIGRFGVIEAQRHRSRGITLSLFLGLIKYYRQAYLDLIEKRTELELINKREFSLFIHRSFEKIELAFCQEWFKITENHKLVELQNKNRFLTAEKNQYLTIFESINNPIFVLDNHQKIVNLNPEAAKVFTHLSLPGALYYSEEKIDLDLPWLNDAIESLTASDSQGFPWELWLNTNVGQRCFEVKCKPMLDISEKFAGTVVICTDITELREEEKLRISQKELAEAQKIGHIGNWSWYKATDNLIWSEEIYRIVGQDPQTFQPTHGEFLKLVHQEDRKQLQHWENLTLKQRKKEPIEYRVIKPDGSICWIQQEAVTTKDDHQKAIGLTGTLQDITAQKQAEESLKIQEFALASSISAIAIGDLSGNLTYINQAFLNLWDFSDASQVLGQSFLKFWQIPKQAKKVLYTIGDRGQWIGELVGRRQDGSLFDAQVSGNLVINGKQTICMMVSVVDITQQKSAEKSLQKLLRLYTSLTEAAPVGILRIDLQGNCIYANEKACEIIGIKDEQKTGWLDGLHSEDRERVLKEWAKALKNLIPLRTEYRYQQDPQKLTWVLAQAIPETDEQGKIVGYISILTDITERKQAEEGTQQINAEMQAILNTFPDIFFRTNEWGEILDYKIQESLSLDEPPENFIGQNIQDAFPKNIGKKVYNSICKALRTKRLISVEYELTIHQKEEFFEARIVPFNTHQTIAIVRNITDRKQTELALRESEVRLRTIIKTSPSGLIILDPQGIVLFVNPAAEKLFGRPVEDLLGEVLGIPIVGTKFSEIEIPQPSGNLIITQIQVVEIIWEGKPASLASLADITALKQAQEQLQILHQAIEQSPVSVLITDSEGSIEYVNPKFEELTGYCRKEAIGQNPRILKAGQMPEEQYKELWKTITAGQEWHGEFHNRKKNGEFFWESASISPIKNEEGMITHFIGIKEDITHKKAQEEILAYQANYDALTGLPNRFLALDRLRQAIMQSERNHKRVAVMFVDLDHFKDVNDTLGHEYGDLLLQQVAERVSNCLRKSDTVARLGGDEFLIIIPDLEESKQCKQVASKILSTLEMPFDLLGEEAFISGSIGITIYPDDGHDVSALMRNADAAMYKGKRGGRNDFKFYTPGMNEATQQRLKLENGLRHSLEKNELFVVYQPFIDLKSGAIVGAEALLRWQSKEFGRVSPEKFIPIAEETGLINELGAWVLSQACQEVSHWRREGIPIWAAVNLSPRQFREANFLEIINRAIAEHNLNYNDLELEITEKLLLEDFPTAKTIIQQLHNLKFRLSIDDFGTGYSSLSYLTKFPFDNLKIDRSFIAQTPDSAESVALVKTMIAMGHGLNLKVIAEGVETIAQSEFLKAEGCDYAQGYFFSPPLAAKPFQNYLKTQYPQKLSYD